MEGEHPDPNGFLDTWMGDSRGRWEGDTLVVDLRNFNDQTWFDKAGNFHSDALHVVERYSLADAGHMNYEVTIDDPKVFTKAMENEHAAVSPDGKQREIVGIRVCLLYPRGEIQERSLHKVVIHEVQMSRQLLRHDHYPRRPYSTTVLGWVRLSRQAARRPPVSPLLRRGQAPRRNLNGRRRALRTGSRISREATREPASMAWPPSADGVERTPRRGKSARG